MIYNYNIEDFITSTDTAHEFINQKELNQEISFWKWLLNEIVLYESQKVSASNRGYQEHIVQHRKEYCLLQIESIPKKFQESNYKLKWNDDKNILGCLFYELKVKGLISNTKDEIAQFLVNSFENAGSYQTLLKILSKSDDGELRRTLVNGDSKVNLKINKK